VIVANTQGEKSKPWAKLYSNGAIIGTILLSWATPAIATFFGVALTATSVPMLILGVFVAGLGLWKVMVVKFGGEVPLANDSAAFFRGHHLLNMTQPKQQQTEEDKKVAGALPNSNSQLSRSGQPQHNTTSTNSITAQPGARPQAGANTGHSAGTNTTAGSNKSLGGAHTSPPASGRTDVSAPRANKVQAVALPANKGADVAPSANKGPDVAPSANKGPDVQNSSTSPNGSGSSGVPLAPPAPETK
jgi:hypothetical protein